MVILHDLKVILWDSLIIATAKVILDILRATLRTMANTARAMCHFTSLACMWLYTTLTTGCNSSIKQTSKFCRQASNHSYNCAKYIMRCTHDRKHDSWHGLDKILSPTQYFVHKSGVTDGQITYNSFVFEL
jgi:hypothetical protein